MTKYIFISIFLISYIVTSQTTDSLKTKPVFKAMRLQQTKICQNMRVGLGTQKSLMAEIGYSRMKHIASCTGFFSKTYYSTLEYVPKTPNYDAVFGLKIGLEYNLSIIAVGLETKYQTDFNNKDFVITPKIGVGLSYINLFYGYNISTDKNPFPSVGNHQFSLVFNISFTSYEK